MIPTDLSPQYIAGILDGEGCISIAKNGESSGWITIHVAMTARIIPDLLYARYGGSLSTSNGNPGVHKDLTTWMIASRKAEVVLKEVLEFLVVKKEQAEVALDFQSTSKPNGGRPLHYTVYERRKLLIGRMRNLNRRGVCSPA